MPIPKTVARINKRVTNQLTRLFAGRAPFFALVEHTGRRSGAAYRTPVNAFPTADGFAIALTYGREVDWLRNVLAAGSATIEHRGSRITVSEPHVVGIDEAERWIPALVRLILRVIGVNEALVIRRSS
jgi:deazaflavin-dependent oxidoreductase (nitroreductase family)